MGEQLGIGFLGGPDLRTMVDLARRAEERGFESAWFAETRITRDAVSAMSALLLGTARMRVGCAAINVYTRGAALTALTFATLDEAGPGRVVLGIGPGSPGPLAEQGYAFDRPVSRLVEYVDALRAAWSDDLVHHSSASVRFAGLRPEVRPPGPVPVYFCVTGPRALSIAGRMADGVILNAFMPPSYIERARARLDDGAGGRFRGELADCLVVAMADTVGEAAARVRPVLATYLVHFPNLASETGIDADFLTHLRRRAAEEGFPAACELLPDELVARHALVGPPEACRERLLAYRAAGLELPLLFPDEQSLLPVIEAFGG
jgi:5,10-methylenetetrahydromethanopterin reductase